MDFVLDPRLAADTHFVGTLGHSDLLVMDDARYPWAILVPHVVGARELYDLPEAEAAAVWQSVLAISARIAKWGGVDKVNVGALGNVVAQLHIHIIGRATSDPAWPGPVWGHSPRVPYTEGAHVAFGEAILEAGRTLG
jgi:diadenosine tetraphosphate (Ap4A) HIT family hydrolase